MDAPDQHEAARLLLLTRSDAWADWAARETADAPRVVREPEAALMLLSRGAAFSHVLIDFRAAGPLLGDLLGLTVGQPDSGIGAVLLGPDDAAPGTLEGAERAARVPSPEPGGLVRALAATAPSAGGPAGIAGLLAALDAGRITMHYQPVVDLARRLPIGLEALAQLAHPELGMLGPDRFVPLIERAGHALGLAEAVARRAFADWRGDALARLGVWLAMNLPFDVLVAPDAADRLEAWREAWRIEAGRIVIELTERPPVERPEALRAVLGRLRDLGYRVAIDDVGPAMPDLERLLTLPFTALKLDKALVVASAADAGARQLLGRITAEGHAAGMQVIAEGVEDEAAWRRMAGLGVDAAQGYFIGRPLTVATVGLWHAEWTRG